MSQYPLFSLPLEQLAPDQRALLERVDAALARMEARGEHLREDRVLPDGTRYGYFNLKAKRDRIAAGEPFEAYPMVREQLALIAYWGAAIRKGAGTLGLAAVYRDDPKGWTPEKSAEAFWPLLPDSVKRGKL